MLAALAKPGAGHRMVISEDSGQSPVEEIDADLVLPDLWCMRALGGVADS
ncbi:hypothetical protein [Devosia sp. 2618]